MASRKNLSRTLSSWLEVPETIESAVGGLTETDLDLRGGPDGYSIRENVHHLVEANLIASNIIIAALSNSGIKYDWSWVNPDKSWMQRLGYDKAPIGPAIATLRALCRHIAGLIGSNQDASRREVKLLDNPGAGLYSMTVEGMIQQEVGHAKEHMDHVAQTRKQHGC